MSSGGSLDILTKSSWPDLSEAVVLCCSGDYALRWRASQCFPSAMGSGSPDKFGAKQLSPIGHLIDPTGNLEIQQTVIVENVLVSGPAFWPRSCCRFPSTGWLHPPSSPLLQAGFTQSPSAGLRLPSMSVNWPIRPNFLTSNFCVDPNLDKA